MSTGASDPNIPHDPLPSPTRASPRPSRLLGLFTHIPADDSMIEEVNTAITLIRGNPDIPQAIKDHLTKVFSVPDIPDVGRLAKTIISNHKRVNSCIQFAKAFTEGMRFLRTSGAGRSTSSIESSHDGLISSSLFVSRFTPLCLYVKSYRRRLRTISFAIYYRRA